MYLDKCCIVELLDKPGLVQITGPCQHCGESWALVALKENLERLVDGRDIQKVFPNMLLKTRVLLVEGLCSVCQEASKTSDPIRGSVSDNKETQS